jgi:hypothetical protein
MSAEDREPGSKEEEEEVEGGVDDEGDDDELDEEEEAVGKEWSKEAEGTLQGVKREETFRPPSGARNAGRTRRWTTSI